METTAQLTRLTVMDRCDRCGAQAYVRVELASTADLIFCGHHAKQYEDSLFEIAIAIYDETSLLSPHG